MINSTGKVLEILCTGTFTTADMRRRVKILSKSFFEYVFFKDSTTIVLDSLQEYIVSKSSDSDKNILFQVLPVAVAEINVSNIERYFTKLKEEIGLLEVLPLYLPTELPETEIFKISIWCRKQISPHILLDVHIDESVVGGCAFVHDNKYYESSFRRLIVKHPDIITGIIDQYAE
jgi:F0F1-type ATP synthase delta subunit